MIMKIMLAGILAAAVGFSYSLATSGRDVETASVESRGAGSNLRIPLKFTNPLLSGGGRDLGDAAFGSAIVRFAQARGGFPPRRFTTDKQNSEFMGNVQLSDAVKALPASVQPEKTTAIMQLTGRLSGAIGGVVPFAGPDIPLNFDVTVTDSKGNTPNTVTESYRLTMTDSNTFKFAQSALADGISFRHYLDRLEVIAGNAPYTFSASNITVTDAAGGVQPIASFQDIGMFFSATNGRLVGRPLVVGKVSFMASCKDSTGAQAMSRDRASVGQLITFNIEQNPRVSTELFATAITIKGDVTNGGKDSIAYTGIVNVDGTTLSKLKGSVVNMTIGDYTTPDVVLDDKGKGSTVKSKTSATVTVSVSNTGQLKINVSNENFGKQGLIVNAGQLAKSLAILPVLVTIGDDFSTSELLKFQQKAKSNLFQETYKFGPGNLGGGFFITSVTGKDDSKSGIEADAWKVSFAALPPNEQKITNATTATVGIGTNFTDTIKVGEKNGNLVTAEKRDASKPVVLKIALTAKGKGGLITSFLPRVSTAQDTNTDIPSALKAGGKKTRFPLLIDVNDANGKGVFGAEGSRAIFPRGDTWVSKDLTK